MEHQYFERTAHHMYGRRDARGDGPKKLPESLRSRLYHGECRLLRHRRRDLDRSAHYDRLERPSSNILTRQYGKNEPSKKNGHGGRDRIIDHALRVYHCLYICERRGDRGDRRFQQPELHYIAMNLFLPLVGRALADASITINTNLPGPSAPSAGLAGLIINFYSFALMMSGILAFGAIVWGGIKYATGRGNPSAESEGRSWITNALLGLLLLAAA